MAEKRGYLTSEAAETLAVDALAFLADRPEALGRFLALAGIGPASLRSTASDPGFLRGVLDYLVGDEAMLIAYATHAGIPPQKVVNARSILNGHD